MDSRNQWCVTLAQRGRSRAGGSVRQTRQPDPGVNQAGRYGNVDPGFNQPGRVGNVGGVRPVAYPVPAGAYYADYDAWRVARGVTVAIAIGTLLTVPPPQTTTVVVQQTTYYVSDGVHYQQVMYSGQVVYQVVPAPPGAW